MNPAAELGALIYEFREDAYLTQAQLASELGVSQPAVSAWERGLQLPRQWTMKRLSMMAPGFADEMAEVWTKGRGEYYGRPRRKAAE